MKKIMLVAAAPMTLATLLSTTQAHAEEIDVLKVDEKEKIEQLLTAVTVKEKTAEAKLTYEKLTKEETLTPLEENALKVAKLNAQSQRVILEKKLPKEESIEKDKVEDIVTPTERPMQTVQQETYIEPVQQETSVEPTPVQTTPQQVIAPSTEGSANSYPWGQCTWGAKNLAPWAGDYWGDAGMWAASAAAEGFEIGYEPRVGAIAVWSGNHVAYVVEVQNTNSIRVYESNFNGNQYIADFRGFFDPTIAQGTVTYIYPR